MLHNRFTVLWANISRVANKSDSLSQLLKYSKIYTNQFTQMDAIFPTLKGGERPIF